MFVLFSNNEKQGQKMLSDVLKVNGAEGFEFKFSVFNFQILCSFLYRTQGTMLNVYCKDK